MSADRLTTRCTGEPCQSYRPGHHMHVSHARRIGETPWGWRDAIVTAISGQVIAVGYVHDDACPTVWHHRSLIEYLRPGDPVRLHERYYALGCAAGWFNVVIEAGLGPVPEPDDPSVWAAQTSVGIVDMATGAALPMDHVT